MHQDLRYYVSHQYVNYDHYRLYLLIIYIHIDSSSSCDQANRTLYTPLSFEIKSPSMYTWPQSVDHYQVLTFTFTLYI